MATLEQIAAALKKADAAGNTDDAKKLADAYRAMQGAEGPSAQERYDAALAKVRQVQFPDMTDEQFSEYAKKALGPYSATEQSQHGQTFGLTDEISSAVAGLGNQVRNMVTGQGPDFGEGYGLMKELQEARRDLGREQNGAGGTLAEVAGGLAAVGPGAVAAGGNALVNTVKGIGQAAAEGGAYGAGSTDGGLSERLEGAGAGAAIGAGLGAAGGMVGAGVNTVLNRGANKAAAKAVPAAAELKDVASATYKVAEDTGAQLGNGALQILKHDVNALVGDAGALLPSGKVAPGFSRLKGALKAVDEYATGELSIKQLQTLRKVFSNVAGSNDKVEARMGAMMLDQLDNFVDGLPAQAFSKGDGEAAAAALKQAKAEYAVAMRTGTIEKIMSDAKIAKSGFAEGLKSGLRSLLKNPKRLRGFTEAEIAEMRRFVEGGPISNFFKTLSGWRGVTGGAAGAVAGGPIGAVALPVAGLVSKFGLGRAASSEADLLRGLVGSGGVLPKPGTNLDLNALFVGGGNPLLENQRRGLTDIF